MKNPNASAAHREREREQAIDSLENRFVDSNEGRALAGVARCADLAFCHHNTIRAAISAGKLVGSRRAKNGPILIRLRELARWIVDGERDSLPA